MQPVILDTDVASLLHRRKLTGPLATRLIGREPLITFITFGELAKWAEIRHWGSYRRGELRYGVRERYHQGCHRGRNQCVSHTAVHRPGYQQKAKERSERDVLRAIRRGIDSGQPGA